MRTLIIALIFLAALASSALAQQAPTQTPQQASLDGLLKACRAVAEELTAARAYIKTLELQAEASNAAIAAHKEQLTALTEALKLSKDETKQHQAIEANQSAQIETQAKQVAELNTQLTRTKAKLSTARKIAAGAGIGLLIAVFLAGR